MAERVTFVTDDGVTIVADWVGSPTTIGAVILVHSMRDTRKAWASFQAALALKGLASLAIDLRGHGESTTGPNDSTVDMTTFRDEEHQSSLYDLIGAYRWIRNRGIDEERVSLAGASIGANLAVQMLAEDTSLRGAVLLSPGRAYHGLNAALDVGAILPHQSLWIAASEGDDQESFDSSKEIYANAPSDRKIFIPLKQSGHGLNLFTAKPELVDQAISFLREITQQI